MFIMRLKNIMLILGLVFLSNSVLSVPDQKQLLLNNAFYADLGKTAPVSRDFIFENKLNMIVQGRGLIKSVQKMQRYKKNFRITLIDQDAERHNFKIILYIYIDNKNSISLTKENEKLEFSGQLVAYTPVNSKRDAYILDIIFEKGAILFE